MKFLAIAIWCMLQTADAELARLEEWAKTQPQNGPGQMGIGDEYYKSSKKFPKDRSKFMDKANEWWAKAWPMLDPVWQEKTRVNLKRIYAGGARSKSIPNEWRAAQCFKATLSGEMPHLGAFALKVEPNKNTGLAQCLDCSPVRVQPGKHYTFSYWTLSDGTGAPTIRLDVVFSDASGQRTGIMETGSLADCPVWVHVVKTGVIPDGTVSAHVGNVSDMRQGFMMFDDISLLVDGKEVLQNGGFEK